MKIRLIGVLALVGLVGVLATAAFAGRRAHTNGR